MIEDFLNDKPNGKVKINDFHFSEEEKERGIERLMKRIDRYERRKSVRRWSIAACVAALVAVGGGVMYSAMSDADEAEMVAAVKPADYDIVLTMEDGSSIVLDDNAQVACAESGALSVNGEEKAAEGANMCTLHVPDGKRSSITMSDGTRLWVNSASTVNFPTEFGEGEKRINVDGEVYLEVAHNEACPFVVATDNFDVKVLGTKFGLTAYSHQKAKNVVLAEGSIEVEMHDGSSTTLRPNDLFCMKDGKCSVSQVDPYTYISWKDNLLYLNNESVTEVMNRLAHQYAVGIMCNGNVSNIRLQGKLVLADSIEEVLNNLSVIYPIDYGVKDNQITVKFKN